MKKFSTMYDMVIAYASENNLHHLDAAHLVDIETKSIKGFGIVE